MKKINVGIIGLGTVGSSVYKILSSSKSKIKKDLGLDIEIRKICDLKLQNLSLKKKEKDKFTKNFLDIINDPEIHIVVELIGGIHPAKIIIEKALNNGKNIVTANKALLADNFELFDTAYKNKRLIKFEASVGGGIPVIRSIQKNFAADKIENIDGILNGTCNYILTRMEKDQCGFLKALKMAQKNGYAEKDPALDVNGLDSVHKLVVLANLCFNLKLKTKDIYCEGITCIEYSDILYAKEYGYKIKLLAVAKNKSGKLELRVHPALVPEDHLLSSVKGIYNAIYIESFLTGKTLLYGKGAGGFPTGNAVVSDVIDIAEEINKGTVDVFKKTANPEKFVLKDIKDIVTRYYLRLMVIDKPGVLSKISNILGKCNISIASVKQKERKKSSMVPLVMMTHEAKESDIQKAVNGLKKLGEVKNSPVVIRIENKIK